jgi:TPP-dependent pyruvate/acetoin dehydrogenase alpha subunit
MQNRQQVTACFFGEGAVAEGEFHESLNLAALWQLPVLFICENNFYAMGTALDRSESETDIHAKANGYHIPSEVVDGMNIVEVEAATRRAISAIRSNGGPYFLECRTYRFRAHSMFDPQLYRSKEEVQEWEKKGPILRFRTWLLSSNIVHESDITDIEKAVEEEIQAAIAFAEASPWENPEDLLNDVRAQA